MKTFDEPCVICGNMILYRMRAYDPTPVKPNGYCCKDCYNSVVKRAKIKIAMWIPRPTKRVPWWKEL